ncbi:MAG: excinuclease ABC subunit A, partial [Rikenellaceae bacterium]|nr:excinuclease ABC subunit A [Rikenellaceae bacterium]
MNTDTDHYIHVKGARVHNLKNIEVKIPHNQLVVITGLSGSGKSTLAFDTIFAEGQRRYVESLSAYARQFLGKINKPDVDFITGIAPAIAIEQKVNTRNSRSTVGTTTEIYDYLKLLFARIGHTFSPVSGREVRAHSVDDVVYYLLSLPEDSRMMVLAPLVLLPNQGLIEKLTLLVKDGLQRVWVDGQARFIEDVLPEIDKYAATDLQILIDRGRISKDEETANRFSESVQTAFQFGEGICRVSYRNDREQWIDCDFNSRFEMDGIVFDQPNEQMFSFNNPIGACPRCEGYGKVIGIDEDLVVPVKSKSIYDDAIACWRGDTMKQWKEQLIRHASKFDFPIHRPFYDLSPEQKKLLWKGNKYFHGLNEFFEFLERERYKIQY